MIDEVICGTAKVDVMPDDMDNNMCIGVEDQSSSQLEEEIQQAPEKKSESLKTRVSNFPGVRGQSVKRRKLINI